MAPWLLIPWFRLQPWPIALPFGITFQLQPFGILAAVAMVACFCFAAVRGEQLRLDGRLLSDFLARVTLAGVISAYLLNIVLYAPELWSEIAAQPWRLVTHWYGLSSYGGFIGGTLAACQFAHMRRASLLKLGDAWCFSFPFAWFFARLGCFVVHDHPGVASAFPLAVAHWNGTGVARHDLGLYEVLWCMPVALWFWRSRLRDPAPGYFLGLLCTAYGPMRFALDFLRADAANGGDIRYAGLTPAQYLSLGVAAFGIILLMRLRTQRSTSGLAGLVLCIAPACAGDGDGPGLSSTEQPVRATTVHVAAAGTEANIMPYPRGRSGELEQHRGRLASAAPSGESEAPADQRKVPSVLTLLPAWPSRDVLQLAPKLWDHTRQQPQTQQLAAACLLGRFDEVHAADPTTRC